VVVGPASSPDADADSASEAASEDEAKEEKDDLSDAPCSADAVSVAVPVAVAVAAPASVPVHVYKKAQLLASDLVGRCGDSEPALRGCAQELAALTVFADNVLPAMMVHCGLLTLCPRYAAAIESQTPLSTSAAYSIRAATVVCGELLLDIANAALEGVDVTAASADHAYGPILARYVTRPVPVVDQQTREPVTLQLPVAAEIPSMRTRITGPELDYFFYHLGKKGDNRKIERHVFKKTIAY
jgi:hypothetical protein